MKKIRCTLKMQNLSVNMLVKRFPAVMSSTLASSEITWRNVMKHLREELYKI